MDYTQTDIDSLAAKLDALTDEEKAALAAAIAETVGGEVEGFALNAYCALMLNDQQIFGTDLGRNNFVSPGTISNVATSNVAMDPGVTK